MYPENNSNLGKRQQRHNFQITSLVKFGLLTGILL